MFGKLYKQLSSVEAKKQGGITLIEVLASLVILSIILLTFFHYFNQALMFSSKNEDKLVAYNLARKTLGIVEENYKNPIQDQLITCQSFPDNYREELRTVLKPLTCYYELNNRNYYPEIKISKQTFSKFTNPVLYLIHIKIYSSDNLIERELLSETFGYIRGGTS